MQEGGGWCCEFLNSPLFFKFLLLAAHDTPSLISPQTTLQPAPSAAATKSPPKSGLLRTRLLVFLSPRTPGSPPQTLSTLAIAPRTRMRARWPPPPWALPSKAAPLSLPCLTTSLPTAAWAMKAAPGCFMGAARLARGGPCSMRMRWGSSCAPRWGQT